MVINKIKIETILKEIVDDNNHYKSKFSISTYGSRGKRYLYLYRMQKNNGGV